MTEPWLAAVQVDGHSMRPRLRAGDRLLIESRTFRRRPPRVGELVVVADPRDGDRELVKRVSAVEDGWVELRGDDPRHSTDSRSFGRLWATDVRWRVLLRYWPVWRRARPRSPGSD